MKPELVKGTRDFGPEVVNKRNFIFSTVKKVFVKYGFNPLETPAMEELSTLTGKYGDEGDQLLFKILNNGDYLTGKKSSTALIPFLIPQKEKESMKRVFYAVYKDFFNSQQNFENIKENFEAITQKHLTKSVIQEIKSHFSFLKTYFDEIDISTNGKLFKNLQNIINSDSEKKDKIIGKTTRYKFNSFISKKINNLKIKQLTPANLAKDICSRALRYDLTVPFARYVVLNQNDLAFPFKRYQIQPVWRADNPQKGRYREFYQCDVDVIGSDSLLYEAELAQIYDEAFADLGLKVVIRMNNRKILDGLAQYCGKPDLFMPITVTIDKLDKITWTGVQAELERLDIVGDDFEKVKAVVNAPDIATLKNLFQGIEVGMKGIEELETVQAFLEGYEFKNTFKLDFSLARGLSYYTGCIYEVEVDKSVESQKNIKMGSIGGGGRYANLTGVFGGNNMSGVGVSFGADRVFDVMEELGLFPKEASGSSKVLFLPKDDAALIYGFTALQKVRTAGIPSIIYPQADKFQKLIKYAEKIKVPFVVIIGSKEMETGRLTFKDMTSGVQQELTIEEIVNQFNA